MRGAIKYIALAVATTVISCQKNSEEAGVLEVAVSDICQFSASCDSGPRTKTMADGNSVYWCPADQIQIFASSGESSVFTGQNTEPSASAIFSGELDGESEKYYAVYPYREDNAFADGVITLTLPETQNAVAGTFDNKLFPAVAISETRELHFKNLCGGVYFSVSQEGIDKIIIRGNNEESIAGKVTVEINEDGIPFVKEVLDSKKTVVINAPEGGFVVGAYYYAILFPQVFSKGLTVTFHMASGLESVYLNGTTKNVRRSIFATMDKKDIGLDFIPEGNIVFADAGVKSACVAAFDYNGDGELSYAEAVAVSSMEGVLTGDSYESFDEFRHFKGITSIGAGWFTDRTKLKSITLPESVEDVDALAFKGCSGLSRVAFGGILAESTTLQTLFPDSYESIEDVEILNYSGDYSLADDCFADAKGMTSITLAEGLVEIGERAFRRCIGLAAIAFPSSLSVIKEDAFNGSRIARVYLTDLSAWCNVNMMCVSYRSPLSYCESMYLNGEEIVDLVIPEGVTHIGAKTFYSWSKGFNFKSITIPNSVMSIGESAFGRCSGISRVTIPSSVTSVGSNAFWGCTALERVDISDLKAWCNIDFDVYGNPLEEAHHLYLNGEEIVDLVIPEGVPSIGNRAFSGGSGIKSVTFPNGIVSIGDYAFSGCSVGESLSLPNSLSKMGNEILGNDFSGILKVNVGSAFCASSSSVSLSKLSSSTKCQFDVIIDDGVTEIGGEAFQNVRQLMGINIPNSVKTISSNAFKGCASIVKVGIGDCFYYNGQSVEDIFPDSFSKITDLAFVEGVQDVVFNSITIPPSLNSVTIPKTATSIRSIHQNLGFVNPYPSISRICISDLSAWCGIEFERYNNPLKYVHHLFLNEEEIIDLLIPNDVSKVGAYAFEGATSLSSVTIPDSVTSIGSNAFSGCSGMSVVSIPSSITSLGYEAFQNCTGLKRVDISDLKAWCNIDFGGNPLEMAHHLYLNGEEIVDLVIPDGVTSIGNRAFDGGSSLKSVTFPNGIVSIGNSAFYGCSGLTEITIPGSVTSIGFVAFSKCTGLERVNICDLKAWCSIVFNGSGNPIEEAHHLYLNGEEIVDLVIPEGVTSIGSCAFSGCSGLTEITIPEGVTSIGNSTFFGCTGLSSVTIPNSVVRIGDCAFHNCSGLKSVYVLCFTPPDIPADECLIGSDGVVWFYCNPFNMTTQQANTNGYPIYVPEASFDSYKTAVGWRDLVSRLRTY